MHQYRVTRDFFCQELFIFVIFSNTNEVDQPLFVSAIGLKKGASTYIPRLRISCLNRLQMVVD